MLSARSITNNVQGGKFEALLLEQVATERPILLLQRKKWEPSPVALALIEFFQTMAKPNAPAVGNT